MKIGVFFIVCFTSASLAQEREGNPKLETWQLQDGSSHKARLLYFTDNEGADKKQIITVMMAGEDNVIQAYPLNRFSNAARDLLIKRRLDFPVRGYEQKLGYQFPPEPPTGWQYASQGKATRKSIPSYNQTDYGFKAGSCVTNAFVNTLAWWDQQKMIDIPQKRSVDKQVDWLHTIISRESRTRNRGTSWKHLMEGVQDFNNKSLEGQYRMPCFPIQNVTPEILSLFTRENWAVCLSVEVYHKDKHSGGHGITLVSADKAGKVKINTWGLHIEGQLKAIEPVNKDRRKGKGKDYEIVITNRGLLPERYQNNELKFSIEHDYHPTCYVFLPMERQLAGKKWNPGPEPVIVGDLLGIKKPEPKDVVATPNKKIEQGTRRERTTSIVLKGQKLLKTVIVGHEINTDSNGKKSANLLVRGDGGKVQRITIDDVYEKHRKIYHSFYCRGANTAQANMLKNYQRLATPDSYRYTHFESFQWGFPPKPVSGWMHVASDSIDRADFPMITEETYGQKSAPSVQNAVVNTLIWWHRNGLIKLPDLGSEKKLCSILHKMLTPKHTSHSSERHWEHVAKSVQSLGLKSMKGDTAFICYSGNSSSTYSAKDYHRPLKRLLDRHFGLFLTTTLVSETGESHAIHAMPVLDVTDEGVVTVSSWGVKYKGSFKSERRYTPQNTMESVMYFDVINSEALPKWYKNKRFKMAMHKKFGICGMIPYARAKVGMKWIATPAERSN